MINTTILSWVTFVFFAAFVFYLFRMILGREFWGKLATWTALVGLVRPDGCPDHPLEDVLRFGDRSCPSVQFLRIADFLRLDDCDALSGHGMAFKK